MKLHKMIISLMCLFAANTQANINSELEHQKTCFVELEDSSWMSVKWTMKDLQKCLRCSWPYLDYWGTYSLSISVPFGPSGKFITQNYEHSGGGWTRVGYNPDFTKIGSPSGPNSSKWEDWFPLETGISTWGNGTHSIHFKGEILPLECE